MIIKDKSMERFSLGISITLLSIFVSMFAFISEENKITGFITVGTNPSDTIFTNSLIQFKDINSLSTLATGNYFIDKEGIVYWLDEESRPAIAKVDFVDEVNKNRHIYIDKDGRMGYILSEKNQLQSS